MLRGPQSDTADLRAARLSRARWRGGSSQTCRIHIPLPYHELGLPDIDPNIDKGSY